MDPGIFALYGLHAHGYGSFKTKESDMNETSWTPAELLQLSGGYWSVCALHAGVKLEIFTTLAERAHAATELAGCLQTNDRALTMLLNALSAMGLLEKERDTYRTTDFAAEFLSRKSSRYLGHIILHHQNLMPSWSRLDEAIVTGKPDPERLSMANDMKVRENFEMGMHDLAMQVAPLLASRIDLKGRSRLLDLGGGPGTYSVHFCLHNPELTAVVYDLPLTRPFAEETIARFHMSERISFLAGDFMMEEVPGRYDAAWLSHILHGAGAEASAAILKKAVSSLEPGGIILVQEFVLDDDMCSPIYPALFSLNMLLGTPNGRSFAQGELFSLLGSAGVCNLRRIVIELPNGAGVIAGDVP
jgi:SAM-dependent methyltransferase